MKRLLILGLLLGATGSLPKNLWAESAGPIGFQLYSWKAGSEWRYAVLEGTVPVKNADQVRSRKNRLNNLTFLKGRLAALPAQETVYWRENPSLGFTLPPKEIIYQVEEFTDGAQLDLVMPDDVP